VLIESAHRSRAHVFRACIRPRGRAAAVRRHLAIVDALLVAGLAAEPLLARAGGSGHDERCPAIVARGFTRSGEPACNMSMSAAARNSVCPVIDGNMSVLRS